MSRKSSKPPADVKMPHKEFVERSIKALREPPHKGIHVVFSNFNEAFRQYFGEEPRPIVDKLVTEGFLISRPAKGGAIIMLASDVGTKEKAKINADASAALAKILSQSSN